MPDPSPSPSRQDSAAASNRSPSLAVAAPESAGATPHLVPDPCPPALWTFRKPDVLVLGGGIIGLACARELARHGARVHVLEREEHGAQASKAAAGMLSPLGEAPRPGPFFAACRTSRNLWPSWAAELAEESGVDLDYDSSGALEIALTEGDEARLDALATAAAALGERVEEADLATWRRHVPGLAAAARRGLYLPGEHRVDNLRVCAALGESAARSGVSVTYGAAIERVEVSGSTVRVAAASQSWEADLLVVAAGCWSGSLPGLPVLPLRPVRGQILLFSGVAWDFGGIVRGSGAYTVRRGSDSLLVGATSEEVGFASQTTVGGVHGLLSRGLDLLPGLAGARLEAHWAGLRPGTADGLPLLGHLGEAPVVYATGHYRNGILLAPWTAREVARVALDGETSGELAAFSPQRFVGPTFSQA